MNIERQNELIEYANRHIAPFNPDIMDEKEVYAHLLEDYMDESEIEGEGILLFLELFTKESIGTSIEYLNTKEYKADSFHPAIYTFTVFKDKFSDSQKAMGYCEEIKALCKKNNGWIKGKLCKSSDIGVIGHVSLSFGLVYEKNKDIKLPLEIDAIFASDGSSPSSQILSKFIDSYTKTYRRINDQKTLPPSITGLDPHDDDISVPYKVSIYRVNHGNTITIEKNDKCILFDCGKAASADNKVHNHIIQNVKPTTIIISHWHSDHYNLITENFDKSRLKHVIFPDLPYDPTKQVLTDAINELDKLQKQGVILTNLSGVDTFSKDFLKNYGYHNIFCFLGENRPNPDPADKLGEIGYSRSDDDSGIILSIQSPLYQDLYAILPGDCSYYSWPDEDELNLKNTSMLVLPHHGGQVIIQKNRNKSKKKYRKYYICSEDKPFTNITVGNKKTYHKDFIDDVMHTTHEYIIGKYSKVCAHFHI